MDRLEIVAPEANGEADFWNKRLKSTQEGGWRKYTFRPSLFVQLSRRNSVQQFLNAVQIRML